MFYENIPTLFLYNVDEYTECSVLQQMKESDLFCFSVLELSYGNLPQNLKR